MNRHRRRSICVDEKSLRRRRLGDGSPKARDVTSLRELDDHRRRAAVRLVVLVQLGSEPPRLDPDDGVDLRIEGLPAIEYVHAKRVLLQLLALAFERAVHDMREQTAQAGRVRE